MITNQTKAAVHAAIADLHTTHPARFVIACTGGGAGLQELLWSVGGASETILEAIMPYDSHALIDLIGRAPESYCAPETAIAMAVAAHARARELAIRRNEPYVPVVGLGLTAALATNRARRGTDRVYIASCADGNVIRVATRTFAPVCSDRESQGLLCDLLGLNLMLVTVDKPPVPLDVPFARTIVPPLEIPIMPNRIIRPNGRVWQSADLYPDRHILFPGSFNPLHFGHQQMAAHVEQMTGREVVFTISATHPDKGSIPSDELRRRVEQFRWRWPVMVTKGDPLYVDKAIRFPGFSFLVGVDALYGLLDPKYYGSKAALRRTLDKFLEYRTTFYVVGREIDGVFRTLENIELDIPNKYRGLFLPVHGRWDVRSRDIRK